jgi:ribose/xylose/arabinose/galactoside ABC-type transport system permease subunit
MAESAAAAAGCCWELARLAGEGRTGSFRELQAIASARIGDASPGSSSSSPATTLLGEGAAPLIVRAIVNVGPARADSVYE